MWELLEMGLSTVSDIEYKQIKLYLFIHIVAKHICISYQRIDYTIYL